MKVSVIVPVYNGANFINNCMNCLLGQTMNELEIIAVNDCSKDNSKDVLEAWATRYPDRIRVIYSERNLGAGGARNLGLAHATGDYIGYMDCDDEIDREMYEKLYNIAVSENCDIVDSGYIDEKNGKIVAPWEVQHTGKLDDDKRSKLVCGVGYTVTKLFRREFLINSGVTIRENVIYEDLDYLVKLVLQAARIGTVYEVLYKYAANSDSSSNTSAEQKKFDDMADVISELGLVKKTAIDMTESIEYVILNCFVAAIGQCLFNQENTEFELAVNLKRLRRLMTENFNGDSWKNNKYASSRMEKDNVELINWFYKLRL